MQESDYTLPAVEVFTDYSQWERRPSTKSGTRSTAGRRRVRAKTSSRICRHDALSLAARLSHESVLVDPGPQRHMLTATVVQPHSHCHISSRKLSSITQPRKITTTRFSHRRKIEKAQSLTLSVTYYIQQVS